MRHTPDYDSHRCGARRQRLFSAQIRAPERTVGKLFVFIFMLLATAPLWGQCEAYVSQPMPEPQKFNTFTREQDRMHGEYVSLGFETMLEERPNKPAARIDDPLIMDYLVELSRKILLSGPEMMRQFKYTIGLIRADNPNAFSLGGGVTLVTLGEIAQAPSEDFLAMVFAHEFAHTALRHRTAFLSRLNFDRIQGMQFDPRLKLLHEQFELEADVYGVRAAVAAGYSPASLVAHFRAREEKESKSARRLEKRAMIFECAAQGHALGDEASQPKFVAAKERARLLVAPENKKGL